MQRYRCAFSVLFLLPCVTYSGEGRRSVCFRRVSSVPTLALLWLLVCWGLRLVASSRRGEVCRGSLSFRLGRGVCSGLVFDLEPSPENRRVPVPRGLFETKWRCWRSLDWGKQHFPRVKSLSKCLPSLLLTRERIPEV